MNKISRLLLLVMVFVLGFVLVGCQDKPEPEPDPIAPTSIKVDATIYSGSETEKYVLVGSKMYVEAELEGEEGFSDELEWSISGDAATLAVEDGAAVVTGVEGGNAVVTAKSKVDASVSGTYTVEVVDSEDFNEVVVAAKDAVVAALPEYVKADFALPQPANPNVKVTYMSKLKKTWSDGQFHFAEAYSADKGDSLYVFYATFQFHGVKKEFELSVKCVGDLVDNDFYALSAAKSQVEAIFAENKNISGSFPGMIDNNDGSYTLELPAKINVEGTTKNIGIEWAVDENAKGLKIETSARDGVPIYKLVYTKPLVDSLCQVNAIYKSLYKNAKGEDVSRNNDISKLYLTALGYTPDEVWAYFKEKCYKSTYYNAATDTFAVSTAGFTVPTTDTSKKFKAVTVEYEVLEESAAILSYTAPSGTSTTGTFRKLGAGEAKVKITVYYNKNIRKVMIDKLDENGELVKDAEGNVVQEEVEQLVCDWKQEYDIVITLR